MPINPPPSQPAKWGISSWISIRRDSKRIANTQPKLRTNTPKIANKQNYEKRAFLRNKEPFFLSLPEWREPLFQEPLLGRPEFPYNVCFSGGGGAETSSFMDVALPCFDAEYDRAEVSTAQWKWSLPAPGSLKALLLPPDLNKLQNKGTQGYRRGAARNFLHSFPLSSARSSGHIGHGMLSSGRGGLSVKRIHACTPWHTIHTEMITNENLEILFRFRFRNGKAK